MKQAVKTNWLNNRLYAEVQCLLFSLQDAIVQSGSKLNAANYYVNAGNTKQKGLKHNSPTNCFHLSGHGFAASSKLWVSYTYNDFRYDNFKQLNSRLFRQ